MSNTETTSTAMPPSTKSVTATTDGMAAIIRDNRVDVLLVGSIVLLHVDPDIVRPLLVVSMQGRRVSGVLTVDPNLDSGSRFVSQRWFYKPDVNAHTKFICEVEPGSGVGQYLTRAEYMEGRG